MPDLPKFEGRVPDSAAVSFTGGQEGSPPHIDAYRHGMAVAFLVIGEVGDVTHGEKGGENDRRYVRGHKVVVEKVVYLDPDEAGRVYNDAMERAAKATPVPGTLDGLIDDFNTALGEGNTATLTSASGGNSVTIKGRARATAGPDDPDDEFDGYVPEHPLEALEHDQDSAHDAEHEPAVSDF